MLFSRRAALLSKHAVILKALIVPLPFLRVHLYGEATTPQFASSQPLCDMEKRSASSTDTVIATERWIRVRVGLEDAPPEVLGEFCSLRFLISLALSLCSADLQ